jgi:hypothetical protein
MWLSVTVKYPDFKWTKKSEFQSSEKSEILSVYTRLRNTFLAILLLLLA